MTAGIGTVKSAKAVYFHGAPGGPRELDLSREVASGAPIAIDRFALNAVTSTELVDALLACVDAQAASQPLRLIGFSMGCRWALAVAARLGAQVVRIDLIAPLGPFSLGHYGRELKGYPLFELARKRRGVLGLVLAAQAWLARRSPRSLVQLALQGSRGGDRALAQDPAFRALVATLFLHALGPSRHAYAQELAFASEDWSPLLAEVAAPVHIWHGTEDNWAAPGMGDALARHLRGARITRLAGLSHYSALQHMLPALLHRRADSQGHCFGQ